jgi:hypothetical protein
MAAGNYIGKIKVGIQANTAPFATGLALARRQLREFKGTLDKIAFKPFNQGVSDAEKMLAKLTSGLPSLRTIARGADSSLRGIIAAATFTAKAFKVVAKELLYLTGLTDPLHKGLLRLRWAFDKLSVELGNKLRSAATKSLEYIKAQLSKVADAATKVGNKIGSALSPITSRLAKLGSSMSSMGARLAKTLKPFTDRLVRIGGYAATASGAVGRMVAAIVAKVPYATGVVFGLAKALAKVGGKIGGGIARGASSAFSSIVSGLAGVATAAAGAGIGLLTWAKSSADAIVETTRFASFVGTSTQALTGLEYAASQSGIGAEKLRDGLGDMIEKLGEAKQQGGESAAALAHLGLNVDQLIAQDPVKSFEQIAGALSAIPDQATKAALGAKLFGGSSKELIPLLDQGAEGIQKMRKRAEELGISFNDVEAQQVVKAQQAMSELGSVVSAVGNQLAIQLAPFVTAAVEQFGELTKTGFNMGQIVSNGLELVGTGVGIVADVVHTLGLGFNYLQAGATTAIAYVIKGIASLAEGLEYLVNLLPGVEADFSSTLKTMGDDMMALADEQWAHAQMELTKEPPSTGIKSFFDSIQEQSKLARESIMATNTETKSLGAQFVDLASKIKESEKSLAQQVATFGKSDAGVEAYKLKMLGATDAQLANINALGKQLEALEKQKDAMEKAKEAEDKLTERGKSIFEETRKPLEKYNAKIKELEDLLDAGKIDKDTFNRAKKAATKEFNGDGTDLKLAGVAEFGSAEARTAILRHRGFASNDPMTKVADNTKAGAEAAKKLLPPINRIAKRLDDEVLVSLV